MTKWWFAVVLVLATSHLVLGACPNKCSGHGTCGANDLCTCMQNWIGGDCSGRRCPFTRAWQDTAQKNDDAHYYAECANRGVCDRATGECTCDTGFTGSGCRRMVCPSDCSGHGTCEFIEELASDTFHKRVNGVSGRTYTLWDQEKIMGCVCDPGYDGHDCSKRTCPKGDDPLTSGQYDMKQAIIITPPATATTQEFYLTYYDPYGNAYTTEKIAMGPAFTTGVTAAIVNTNVAAIQTTCTNIQVALRRLPNNVLNTVTVSPLASFYAFTRTDTVGGGTLAPYYMDAGTVALSQVTQAMCEIDFTSEPGTTGSQYLFDCNVAAHNTLGQHPVTGGVVNSASPVATGTCNVYELYPLSITLGAALASGTAAPSLRPFSELTECSGRGTCDYGTGACECFAGHMGLACQKQEALV